jgi:exosortase A
MQAPSTATCARALPLLALLTAASAALWPSWSSLLHNWRSMSEYSHAYLLVPFIAYWIVAQSADLPPPAIRISRLGVAVLVVTLGAWLIAYKAASAIGEQLTIPLILWCAVWTAFGLPIAMRLAAPLACLYFAIPLWEFLIPWLQRIAVFVVETVLQWSNIPVHIDGVRVYIPEGTFEIESGCSGRRYFIVCLTLAAVLAGTLRMPRWRTAAFLALSALMALGMNWLRILIVIYAGHLTNMASYLVAQEHISLGWALFAVLIVLVGMIGVRLAGPGGSDQSGRQGSAYGPQTLLKRPALLATLLVLCIPLLGMEYSREAFASSSVANAHESLRLPPGSRSWKGPLEADTEWSPKYEGTSSTRRIAYANGDSTVQVFIAQYEDAARGAKLVSSANTLLGIDWTAARTGQLGAGSAPADGASAIWADTPHRAHWLVSYWYEVGGNATTNPIVAQATYGILAWKSPVRSRIVAAAIPCRTGCDEERPKLQDFWRSVGYQLIDER